MRIKIGNYYAYDVSNVYRMKENLTTTTVQVIGKKRRGLFKPAIYECLNLDSGSVMWAVKSQLVPTNPITTQYYIRYPVESPMVTKNDIITLNEAIKEIKKHNPNSKTIDDLIALCYKLSFYLSTNDIQDVSEDL